MQKSSGYRYTFVVGLVLASTALTVSFYVHYKFMRLGGPKGYIAPE